MARRNSSTRSAQTSKSREFAKVQRIQDLRRGSRTSPVPSGMEYDRNDWRNQRQAGIYDDDGWN